MVSLDGRRARAQRGRLAAIDAMLELVEEGHAPPTAEQVAERAGISISSVYRYFDTFAELHREMASRYLEAHADLFEIEDEGAGSLADRIDRLVGSRLALYTTIAPLSRLGRSRAVDNPGLDDDLRAARRRLAEQVHRHLRPELDPLGGDDAADLGALVAGLVSIESWEHQRDVLGRTEDEIARSWRLGLARLLAP